MGKALELEFEISTKGESREIEKKEYNTPDFKPLYFASLNEFNVVAAWKPKSHRLSSTSF